MKIRKNYRLQENVVDKLETLKEAAGVDQTDIIERAVEYVHGEYMRALRGMDHDELAICQVMGKPVEKAV